MGHEEQGISPERYMIIPRTLIFIRCGDSFLLLKGNKNKRIWANKYNGVGGHVEKGENILLAAQRELLEETGLSTHLDLCGIVNVDAGGMVGVGMFIFTGEYDGSEIVPSNEGELSWVEIKELDNLPVVEDVKVFLERIIEQNVNERPFFAHSGYDLQGKLFVNFIE